MKTGFLDRVTLCSSCGAPLQASEASEPARCTKCGAENRVVARVDEAVSEGWSEDELARLAHLRGQDATYRPDPSIARFVAGMRLARDTAAHAFLTWQELRERGGSELALTELTLLLRARPARVGANGSNKPGFGPSLARHAGAPRLSHGRRRRRGVVAKDV
jgi:hypothetical protein